MSVAAPVIASIDPAARLIYLLVGVTEYHPVDDIYKEVRNLRRTDETLRPYPVFVTAGGNVSKNAAGTVRTPRYAIFNNCKVVPQDADHDLAITGEQLFADAAGALVGSGKDCVDKTPLSPGTDVNIDYEPPGSEVIIIEQGTSGLTPEESAALLQNTSDLSTMTASVAQIQIDIGAINTNVATLDGNVATIQTDVGQIKIDISAMQGDLSFVYEMERGRWKIETQPGPDFGKMVFYDNGGTPIRTFQLKDAAGNPVAVDPVERDPI